MSCTIRPAMTSDSSNSAKPSRSASADAPPGMAQQVFACQDELLALFETLINVMFCVKDVHGRYIEVNSAFVRRTGNASKREVIGRFAADLFIAELAERYDEQDREVFASGKPLRDQLELIRRPDGALGWYLTTKIPVSGEGDPATLIGLVSVSRDLQTPSEENIALESLQSVVRHVRERLAQPIRVADLAEVAACSEGQLERRMRKVFGQSAQQYVLRVRVESAARMLVETKDSLADIAGACGFYDQSDFTKRFARLTNETPAQFRSNHQRMVD